MKKNCKSKNNIKKESRKKEIRSLKRRKRYVISCTYNPWTTWKNVSTELQSGEFLYLESIGVRHRLLTDLEMEIRSILVDF